jgi:hypothetical protein
VGAEIAPNPSRAGSGRKPGSVCGARGRASQARTREATGSRPAGIKTRLRGASLDWDWPDSRESGGLVPGSPARGQKSPLRCAERRRGLRKKPRPPGWRRTAPPAGGASSGASRRPAPLAYFGSGRFSKPRAQSRRGKENPCPKFRCQPVKRKMKPRCARSRRRKQSSSIARVKATPPCASSTQYSSSGNFARTRPAGARTRAAAT